MSLVTLITGGARSGKSRYAMERAVRTANPVFIATAEAFDGEMRKRIAKHQAERGNRFTTIEEPTDLASAIRRIPPSAGVAVVDCLTVWLGNLIHYRGADLPAYPEVEAFLAALEKPPVDLILVTNEVGMGIVPDNPLSRHFRDLAGWVNARVATLASEVILMVSGLPLVLKRP